MDWHFIMCDNNCKGLSSHRIFSFINMITITDDVILFCCIQFEHLKGQVRGQLTDLTDLSKFHDVKEIEKVMINLSAHVN